MVKPRTGSQSLAEFLKDRYSDPCFLLIYINDLETGLKSSISKFADDTKVGGKALTIGDWK